MCLWVNPLSKAKCATAVDPNTQNWGLSDGLCAAHYKEIKDKVESHPTSKITYTYGVGFLEDYIRLKALMIDSATVESCMDALELELEYGELHRNSHPSDLADRFCTDKTHSAYVRLSRALENYEGLCWFPSNHLIYVGQLSATEFISGLSEGYMPKDPGAGYRHGDFSHRLQWHAVLRVVTNGFTTPSRASWNKTPLELFCSLGAANQMARGLWGYLFDLQIDNTYSNPSNIEAYLRGSGLTLLKANVTRRYVKRKKIEDVVYNQLQKDKVNFTIAAADVVSTLLKWKKIGGKPHWYQSKTPVEKYAAKVWKQYINDQDCVRSSGYQMRDGSTAVLEKSSETVASMTIANRINNSRNAFDTTNFLYDAVIGATKV